MAKIIHKFYNQNDSLQCSPTALVVETEQTHLIDPDYSRFAARTVVAYTNHHHLYLAERRAADNAYPVFRSLAVVLAVYSSVRYALCIAVAQCIASILDFCQLCKRYVYHVLLWPHDGCRDGAVSII